MKEMLKKNSGFTLIEIIMAISVIALVVTAAAQLTQSSLQAGKSSMQRFEANHLAEEGTEIVRNIRDSNWLRNKPWRENLSNGKYEIAQNNLSYSGENNLWRLSRISSDESAGLITLGNNGFKRIIEIAGGPSGEMKVKSRVKYLSRGSENEISIEAELTDWKKGPL